MDWIGVSGWRGARRRGTITRPLLAKAHNKDEQGRAKVAFNDLGIINSLLEYSKNQQRRSWQEDLKEEFLYRLIWCCGMRQLQKKWNSQTGGSHEGAISSLLAAVWSAITEGFPEGTWHPTPISSDRKWPTRRSTICLSGEWGAPRKHQK